MGFYCINMLIETYLTVHMITAYARSPYWPWPRLGEAIYSKLCYVDWVLGICMPYLLTYVLTYLIKSLKEYSSTRLNNYEI